MSIPGAFVWSQIGDESGEPPENILVRKEVERLMGGKKFFWGVGKSVRPFMRDAKNPMAFFTKIDESQEKDAQAPDGVVVWRSYELQGRSEPLPSHVFVASRFDPENPNKPHYALLCKCGEDLRSQNYDESLYPDGLVHYRTGNQLYRQNNTHAVRKGETCGKPHRIVFTASLYGEGQVKLTDRVRCSGEEWKEKKAKVTRLANSILADGGDVEERRMEWKALIGKIKGG